MKWPVEISKKITPSYLIFVFFLFLATILWFLNALNNSYETDIPINIRYINYPEGKILKTELPKHLTIRIQSTGFSILKFKYFTNKSPVINVNSFALNKINKNNPNKFYLLTKNISKQINKQLSHQQEKKIQIKKILPDTLFFDFENIIKKKIAINPFVDINFSKQYNLRGKILSEPDSIVVEGAESIMDTLQYIYTEHLQLENILKTTEIETSLSKINRTSFSTNKVKLTIPVDQFTEKSIDIPIETINMPDSLVLKIFPHKATVSFLVSLADYEKVGAMLFSLNVDYHSITESLNSNPDRIKINIDKYPDYIYSPTVQPNTIQFIIEKR